MRENRKYLSKAQTLSERILQTAEKDAKVKCKSIHLKGDGSCDFTAIFVIPEKAFLSFDIFTKLSVISNDCLPKKIKDNFTYSFMFMPYSKSIDKEALIADGFDYTYDYVKNK